MRGGPLAETRTVQKFITVGTLLSVVAAGVVSAARPSFRLVDGADGGRRGRRRAGRGRTRHGVLVVIQNSYAAANITVEADQKVVSTGLYGLVRHPMYVGALIMMVGMPLALGSYWGLVVAHPGRAGLRRPHPRRGEGAAEELDGYSEYTEKVQYRLVPTCGVVNR